MSRNTKIATAVVLVVIAVIAVPAILQKDVDNTLRSSPSDISSMPPEVVATSALGDRALTAPKTPDADSIEPIDSAFKTVDPSLVDDSLVQKWATARGVNRYRVVEVDTNRLRTHMRGSVAEKPLYLKLFKDATIMGIPYEAKEYSDGPRSGIGSWAGTVNGDGKSVMTVVIGPSGETSIHISSDQGIYNVVRLGRTSYHIVLDHSPVTSYAGDTHEVPERLSEKKPN